MGDKNDCRMCTEGKVIGNSVYCNYIGRFYPLYGDEECTKFSLKKDKKLLQKEGDAKPPDLVP